MAGSAAVTDAEVHEQFEKQNTKVKFDYAVLKKDDILKEIHPNDAELKAYYDRNKTTYNNSIPEKRKVKYVLIETDKIEGQTQVTHDKLQAYYTQHRDEYRVAEQVNVRHILIKTPLPGTDGKVDPKGVEEARKKAEDVLKQLKAGAKFEDLAKKYSEDTTTAKNGGSQGWVQRGRFPSPDIDKVVFSLPKGGTSDVINAGYGFDIIRVDDKQEARVKTLAEVKDQIEAILKPQKAANAADAQANALLTQARKDGLDKTAAARFNRGARDKAPPDEVQLTQGFAVYELEAIKPPSTPSFEEIRSRVETEFKNERSTALLTQKTQELSDRAKAAHDLKKAAKELGATVKTSDFVLPDGQVPDIGSMAGPASMAFTLKPGDISSPVNNGNSGAVLSLLEKQEPAAQDFEAKKDQIRDTLLQNKQSEMFNLFVSNLRTQMEKSGKIKVNEQELKTLTRQTGGDEGE